MSFHDEYLATGGTSEAVMASGNLDFFVIGLLAGTVKLQVLFSDTKTLTAPDWMDLPSIDYSFSSDTAKSIYLGEDQVRVRAVGVGNTDGVYVRFGRA